MANVARIAVEEEDGGDPAGVGGRGGGILLLHQEHVQLGPVSVIYKKNKEIRTKRILSLHVSIKSHC